MPSKTTVESLVVAGSTVGDPIAVVLDYLQTRYPTIAKYDAAAGTSEVITDLLVNATRGPWQMNSRISHWEAHWLVNRSQSAPWRKVPTDAELVDADPNEDGELFDNAEELWNHFWRARPKGIAIAKLSMILHLTRPSLFPLLDSRLLHLYHQSTNRCRLEFEERSRYTSEEVMVWIAIRR